MGVAVFKKINMATVPNPPANTVIVGVDLDGITKQKDSLGTITLLGEPISRINLTLGIVDISQFTPPPAGTMLFAVDLDGSLKQMDENGSISTVGSGNSGFLNITRNGLQNLIATNSVVAGQVYSITDAVEVDYVSNETLLLTGLSTTSLGNGVWNKATKLYPTGKFTIHGGITGTLGSINNIDINGNNLLTMPIPYNGTRYQTALDAASNINANTGIHRWQAYVIEGYSVSDLPTVILEYQGTTNVASTLTVSTTGTLLTVSGTNNIVNPANGQSSSIIQLDITYDVANDKITSAKDRTNNVEFSSSTVISVRNFRWGDPRFINWKMNNVDFINCWFLDSVKMANNDLSNLTFSNVAFGTFADNTFVGGTFTEISAATVFNVQGNRCLSPTFSINRIGSGRLATPSFKAGFNGNFIPATATSGAATTTTITLSGTSGAQAFQFNNNTINGNTLVSNLSTQSTIANNIMSGLTVNNCVGATITANNTNFNISISNSGSAAIVLSRNFIQNNFTINGVLGTTAQISISDNTIYSLFNISNTTINGLVAINNNQRLTINLGFNTYNAISILNNNIANFNISGGSKTFGTFSVSNSSFYGLSWFGVIMANITITNSEIHNILLQLGDLSGAGTWICNSCKILNGCNIAVGVNATLNMATTEMYPVSLLSASEGTTMNISATTFRQASINDSINCEVHYCEFTTTNFYNGGTIGVPELGFANNYDPSQFTLTETNTTGSFVDPTNAPSSVQLFTGDDGSFNPGYVDYTTTVQVAGLITFDWNYTMTDDTSASTTFVFVIDGGELALTGLTDGGGLNQTGSYSINVSAGSTVGFRMYTLNDGAFLSDAVLSNFIFSPHAPAFLQCNATKTVDSTITFAPAYNRYFDMGASIIKSSTVTLDSKYGSSNIDLHGEVISSDVQIDDLQNLTVTDFECKNATLHIRSTNITLDNFKIINASLRNRNFPQGERMGLLYLLSFTIEDSQIGFENFDDSIVPLPFRVMARDTRIVGLLGKVNLGFGEKIYFFPNEMNFQNELNLNSSVIEGRKFVHTQHIAAPNGGNYLTTNTSVIPGFVKTKVSMGAFNSVLTSTNMASNISVMRMGSGLPTDFIGTTTLNLLNASKYFEDNAPDTPVPLGEKAVFGIHIPGASLTGSSEITLTIEGYLADSTK